MTDLVQVFTKNYNLLFRVVFAYVGNTEDAKDILQDAFLRAYKADQTKIPCDKLLPWLIVIARNTSKTFLKKRAKYVSSDDENIAEPYFTPDFLEFTVNDAINGMVSIVPEDICEPLRLHHLEDIPLKRIAKDKGIPYSRLRYWNEIFLKSIENILK